MGFLDGLRKMLQGPPHVQGGDDEGAAALREDYGIADAGEAEVRRMETTGGGSAIPGRAGSVAEEAVEDDFSSEEAPPDLDP